MKTSSHDFGEQEPLFETPVTHDLIDDAELPESTRFEYAKSIVQLQRERRIRKDAGPALRSAAHAELGGGVAEVLEEPDKWYEKYIDSYSDKQLDIKRAFEQFNLPQLHPMAISQMRSDERIILALHLRTFDRELENRIHIFGTEGGFAGPHFARYGFTSDEEASQYAQQLKEFRRDFLQSDIWETVQWIDVGSRTKENDVKRHHGRIPYVIHDTKNRKLRIHYEFPLEHQSVA